jgi:hypothetical protein
VPSVATTVAGDAGWLGSELMNFGNVLTISFKVSSLIHFDSFAFFAQQRISLLETDTLFALGNPDFMSFRTSHALFAWLKIILLLFFQFGKPLFDIIVVQCFKGT